MSGYAAARDVKGVLNPDSTAPNELAKELRLEPRDGRDPTTELQLHSEGGGRRDSPDIRPGAASARLAVAPLNASNPGDYR
jgi:hypothetical protein